MSVGTFKNYFILNHGHKEQCIYYVILLLFLFGGGGHHIIINQINGRKGEALSELKMVLAWGFGICVFGSKKETLNISRPLIEQTIQRTND